LPLFSPTFWRHICFYFSRSSPVVPPFPPPPQGWLRASLNLRSTEPLSFRRLCGLSPPTPFLPPHRYTVPPLTVEGVARLGRFTGSNVDHYMFVLPFFPSGGCHGRFLFFAHPWVDSIVALTSPRLSISEALLLDDPSLPLTPWISL